ncbi:hypothetical protein HPB58_12110 [Priestia filamentosa]|uniref:YiiX/YebB-like N1pC/P60 family cysteine hydrolase n=1 Tax=Priestia filamentosa TaxID=1402861 RepID=UPI001FB54556|nr:YiiX/YebB-like N1pC/P60 family cysteine hydrolase [Priestia filamentosa]UOE62865.1 hypothetical protein HPB58_12110 [Priestia filamentosa]
MLLKKKVLSAAISVIIGITLFLPSASFAHIENEAHMMEQKPVMEPGTILIASDSYQELIPGSGVELNFGHAAIVGPEGTTIIEAPGRFPNGQSAYSQEVPIQEFFNYHPHWKAYVVTNATPEQKHTAAQYARDHLLGKEYPETSDLLYTKEDPDMLYCSSLVWKAWKHAGFDIDYDDGGRESNDGFIIQFLLSYSHLWIPEGLEELFSTEKVDTVFPAEIAQDPALTMIAQGEDDGLVPSDAEFLDLE